MPSQSAIFSFQSPDGKTLYRDPMAAHRRLLRSLGEDDLNQKLNSFESTAPSLSFDAAETLAKAACEAFKIPPLNEETGQGFTEAQAIDVLYGFLAWSAKKNESTETTPSQSASTDTLPDTNSPPTPDTDSI